MHQMWLSRVGLDRKMLFALRENYQDHEAYDAHVKNQVSGVITRMVDSICGQTGKVLRQSRTECPFLLFLGEEQPEEDHTEDGDAAPEDTADDLMCTPPPREERMLDVSPGAGDILSEDAAPEASPSSEQVLPDHTDTRTVIRCHCRCFALRLRVKKNCPNPSESKIWM